jgi:hypothetical protein
MRKSASMPCAVELYLAVALVVEEHICRFDVAMNALQNEKRKSNSETVWVSTFARKDALRLLMNNGVVVSWRRVLCGPCVHAAP